jgi:hypothetical protein
VWILTETWLGEPLLGSPDIQSLADLTNTAHALREMRVVPVSLEIVKTYAMGILLPFLPLLLLRYPIAELAAMLLKRVAGL